MRIGNRAKNIKNTPTVNVERSAKEYIALLDTADKTIKEQEGLIQKLQTQLDAIAKGGAAAGGNFDFSLLNNSILGIIYCESKN
mgnify:CR=1 FL=1